MDSWSSAEVNSVSAPLVGACVCPLANSKMNIL